MYRGVIQFFIQVLLLQGCAAGANAQTGNPVVIEGRTMGTTYHITFFDSLQRDFTSSVDSLLERVNQSINTYDASSEVSLFNKSRKGISFGLPYLKEIIRKSLDIAQQSGGAFDPTVLPLVNAWGFGPRKGRNPTKNVIDSLRTIVGFGKIIIRNDSLLKTDYRVQLDFGGIGQGYGADVIARFLTAKGIENFLVELGGEGIAKGKNAAKKARWKVGILDPNSTLDNQFYKAYVDVNDRSFTTSGNYFNYRIIDGRKYGHTIDPSTGYPVDHSLLSVSVFAADCTTADAWDTALLAMGLDKAIRTLQLRPELEALLIYSSSNGKLETYYTPGLVNYIQLEP